MAVYMSPCLYMYVVYYIISYSASKLLVNCSHYMGNVLEIPLLLVTSQ